MSGYEKRAREFFDSLPSRPVGGHGSNKILALAALLREVAEEAQRSGRWERAFKKGAQLGHDEGQREGWRRGCNWCEADLREYGPERITGDHAATKCAVRANNYEEPEDD